MMDEPSIEGYFAYARERYKILLRQRGERPIGWSESLAKSGRWTNDRILQQYRFCNVFREDDKTTQWFAKHVRDPYRHVPEVMAATIIFRWFNRITTGERLHSQNLMWNWDSHRARCALAELKPLVTGAYMIKTPAKMNKLEGIIWCLEKILPDVPHLSHRIEPGDTTLEGVTDVLKGYPYIGAFMAYEIVTDLRHTKLLENAPDIMTWANPGPGAARGASRVWGAPANTLKRNIAKDYDTIQTIMREILQESTRACSWPKEWPAWEMRDVEHTLCEYDKYERARHGEGRPKQLYRGVQ